MTALDASRIQNDVFVVAGVAVVVGWSVGRSISRLVGRGGGCCCCFLVGLSTNCLGHQRKNEK